MGTRRNSLSRIPQIDDPQPGPGRSNSRLTPMICALRDSASRGGTVPRLHLVACSITSCRTQARGAVTSPHSRIRPHSPSRQRTFQPSTGPAETRVSFDNDERAWLQILRGLCGDVATDPCKEKTKSGRKVEWKTSTQMRTVCSACRFGRRSRAGVSADSRAAAAGQGEDGRARR